MELDDIVFVCVRGVRIRSCTSLFQGRKHAMKTCRAHTTSLPNLTSLCRTMCEPTTGVSRGGNGDLIFAKCMLLYYLLNAVAVVVYIQCIFYLLQPIFRYFKYNQK